MSVQRKMRTLFKLGRNAADDLTDALYRCMPPGRKVIHAPLTLRESAYRGGGPVVRPSMDGPVNWATYSIFGWSDNQNQRYPIPS